MTVDVTYQGLSLAKGAQARAEGGGIFVELETPMPVGTRLELLTPDGIKTGRVDTVVEGAGAGMLVAFGERSKKAAEPNAPMAEMKSAPPVPLAQSQPVAVAASDKVDKDDDEPEPDDPKKKKERRTKPRKTVIGH